ncbi:MAG: hypothetical protein QXU72_08130 [Thermofilum sp.]|uniref:Uncharacterized protein n=1 Tax=Thermofilum pendens TaxID=2269 RepID=A0A7C4HA83_THEPE
MLIPVLAGSLAAMSAALLRVWRGRPSREELVELGLSLTLAFIDGFMVAYLAPFAPVFAAKLSFHLFLYMLLASLTVVLYSSYKGHSELKVYAIAMAPWFFVLFLVAAAAVLGSRIVFIF